MKPGICPMLDPSHPCLHEQWMSDRLEPSLRMVIMVATLLYYELGANRCRVLRLLGNTEEERANRGAPHYAGCGADLGIRELAHHNVMAREGGLAARKWPRVVEVVERLNRLFPRRGSIKTATYEGDRIVLRVPPGGFEKGSYALATWFEAGATGPEPRHRFAKAV